MDFFLPTLDSKSRREGKELSRKKLDGGNERTLLYVAIVSAGRGRKFLKSIFQNITSS